MAYVGSNLGLRCFGKHYPSEAQAGTTLENIIERGDRVLNFGEYRQAVSENSEDVLQFMTETRMAAYTLQCDNADGFFTELSSREIFINGDLLLYQGFDYPDFTFSDFIPLFNGKIHKYDIDYTSIRFHATQTVIAPPADTPAVEVTITYDSQFDGT
ncbi:MAG: hypothetical protein GY841_11230 [FCB group bacterium]|nr:hypothetical protein [FCB group bacterium]